MKELTKAEEQVMHFLWKLEKGFLKDIVEQFPEPRPAYTTISTVIRVLVKKGYIKYNTYGKIHEYIPVFNKTEYSLLKFKNYYTIFFNEFPAQFATFLASQKVFSIEELEEIKSCIEQQIKIRKEDKT